MKRLVMFVACVVLSGTSLFGQTNTLRFDSLPSAQGWSLLNSCASPESSLFSVTNNVLHQNTIGCGQNYAYYTLNNVVTSADFTLTVTARVTSDEVFGNLGHLGLSFGAEGSGKEYYIGLGPGFVEAVVGPGINGTILSTSIDTTQFHTYVLNVTPATGLFTLSVDGSQIGSGTGGDVSGSPNFIFVGDGSSGGNAVGDYILYSYQASVGSARVAYITNAGSNTVSVINPATNSVVATVTVGRNPVHVAVTPNGSSAYVTNAGAGTVSVINTATNTVVATVQVGFNPVHAAVTPNGGSVYITNAGSNTVSVISTATNTVVATVPVGSNPVHVAIAPDGSRVYVTNTGSNNVSLIDTATNTVITTVPVGRNPVSLAVF
jgi:YVTN family beta-propeller protein